MPNKKVCVIISSIRTAVYSVLYCLNCIQRVNACLYDYMPVVHVPICLGMIFQVDRVLEADGSLTY